VLVTYLYIVYITKKTYSRFSMALPLVIIMGLAAPASYAEVTPVPESPAQQTAPAKTSEEHAVAAEHHKKMAEHHHGMATHHKSMASEHKQMGHLSKRLKVFRHYIARRESKLMSLRSEIYRKTYV
jgi:hypothetical protein